MKHSIVFGGTAHSPLLQPSRNGLARVSKSCKKMQEKRTFSCKMVSTGKDQLLGPQQVAMS